MGLVLFLEYAAIISLNNINQFLFRMKMRGIYWRFKYFSYKFQISTAEIRG
jgi:hypothetical protein